MKQLEPVAPELFPDGVAAYKWMRREPKSVFVTSRPKRRIITPFLDTQPRGLQLVARGYLFIVPDVDTGEPSLEGGAIHCLADLDTAERYRHRFGRVGWILFEVRGFGYVAHNGSGHVAFSRIEFLRRVA